MAGEGEPNHEVVSKPQQDSVAAASAAPAQRAEMVKIGDNVRNEEVVGDGGDVVGEKEQELYLFFPKGRFDIRTAKGGICWWFVIFAILILITPILGLVSFYDQRNELSQWTNDELKGICGESDDWGAFESREARINLGWLITLYWVDICWILFIFMFYPILRLLIINISPKFKSIQTCGGGFGGFVLMVLWIGQGLQLTWYITGPIKDMKDNCDDDNNLYGTFIDDNEIAIEFQRAVVYAKAALLVVNICLSLVFTCDCENFDQQYT